MKIGFAVQTPTKQDFDLIRDFIVNNYGTGETFKWEDNPHKTETVIGYWPHRGKNYASRTTLSNFRLNVKGVELFSAKQFNTHYINKNNLW